jgi:hypothetical protein
VAGTAFVVYDNGSNPEKKGDVDARKELAAVFFKRDLVGKEPRRVTYAVPQRDRYGDMTIFQPTTSGGDGSLLDGKEGGEHRKSLCTCAIQRSKTYFNTWFPRQNENYMTYSSKDISYF